MQKRCDAEEEKELIACAQQDIAVFQKVYRLYFPRVYAYVGYHAGRTQDIEDLVAETFLKAINHLGTFKWQGEGSFAAWIFRIARNIVNDFYRRNQRSQKVIQMEELPEMEANTLLPVDIVAQKEKFIYLRKLIDTLSPRPKEILTLKFFGGLRNLEIAELLQLDERTVAAHLCRGIKKLHGKFLHEFARGKGGYEHE